MRLRVAFICAILSNAAEAQWWNPFDGRLRQLETRIATIDEELKALPPEPSEPPSLSFGWHSDPEQSAEIARTVTIDLGAEQPIDAVALVPVHLPYGGMPGAGYGFPLRFRVELSNDARFHNTEVIYDCGNVDFPNPGRLPVWLPANGRTARYVRFSAQKLWSRGDADLVALAEIMVLRGLRNVAIDARVEVTSNQPHASLWKPRNLVDGQTPLGLPTAPLPRDTIATHGCRSWTVRRSESPLWVQVDLGAPVMIEEVRVIPALPPDFPVSRGFGFPVRWQVQAALDERFSSPAELVGPSDEDFPNPYHNIVTIRGRGIIARYVRLSASALWRLRGFDYMFALAEIEAYAGGQNVARGAPVSGSPTVKPAAPGPWDPKHLTDGQAPGGMLIPIGTWLRGLSHRRELQRERAALAAEKMRTAETVSLAAQRSAGVGFVFLPALGAVLYWRTRRHRQRMEIQLRTRIAADLHDEIGCNLGHIALLAEVSCQNAPDIVCEELVEIERIARGASDSMRDIVWLMSKDGTVGDLCARFRETANQALRGLHWTFTAPQTERLLPLVLRREMLFAFKETLHNVRKHAHARHVEIAVCDEAGLFRFSVQDDGRGFDPEAGTTGLGLENLRRRATAAGGRVEVKSAPGEGTRVIFSVPLKRA